MQFIKEKISHLRHKDNGFTLNFFKLPLSTQIIASIIFGCAFGVLLRYFPNLFSFIGVSPASFQKLGTLFIDLIKMVAMPLIFTCIMSSVVSLGKTTAMGKTTLLTIPTFLLLSTICILAGILMVSIFQPGLNSTFDTEHISKVDIDIDKSNSSIDILAFIFNIVPSNIAVSFVQSNFLQIIFFGVVLSIAIARIDEKGDIAKSIKTVTNVFMEMVHIIMRFAPFGTFGMITWMISTQNLQLLKSLGKFVCVNFLSAGVVVYVCYSFICILLRLNPLHLWKKLFPAQLIAFLTTSTTAALPQALYIAEEKLGVSEEKTKFIIPLSAAINTSGSALYFSAMTVFVAQLFGIDLTNSQYLTLFIISIMCSLGTAPIPGGSLFLLGNVFIAVGMPMEALGIAFAIDRVLDMARTFVNLTGDVFVAVIVDRLSGTMNVKEFKKEKSLFAFLKKKEPVIQD